MEKHKLIKLSHKSIRISLLKHVNTQMMNDVGGNDYITPCFLSYHCYQKASNSNEKACLAKFQEK